MGWKLGLGVECNNAAADIDTVRVSVLDPGGQEVASQTASCAAGRTTIQQVPVGTYSVDLEGGKGTDFTIATFRAQIGTVEVEEAGVTDLGTVAMAKVPPTDNPGGLRLAWTFRSGLCGANGVESVRLQVWRELVFDQHDQKYACDIPLPGYVQLDVPPGTYGIVADGLDAEGRIVRQAVKRDVVVEEGQTTSLEGSEALLLEPL